MTNTPKLILGPAQLVQPYGISATREENRTLETAVNFIRSAAELGFRTVDTAPVYGASESVIGVSGIDFAIHTKIEPQIDPAESLRRSLSRLGRTHVDVLYVHDSSALRDPGSSLFNGLNELRNAGSGAIGISIYEKDDLAAIPDRFPIDVVQVPLNVLDRRVDKQFLDEQHRIDRRVIIRSVFLQGALLADPRKTDAKVPGLGRFVRKFQQICDGVGATPLAACLAWARSIKEIDGVIVGAQDIAELEKIVEAWDQADLIPIYDFEDLISPEEHLIDPRQWSR